MQVTISGRILQMQWGTTGAPPWRLSNVASSTILNGGGRTQGLPPARRAISMGQTSFQLMLKEIKGKSSLHPPPSLPSFLPSFMFSFLPLFFYVSSRYEEI